MATAAPTMRLMRGHGHEEHGNLGSIRLRRAFTHTIITGSGPLRQGTRIQQTAITIGGARRRLMVDANVLRDSAEGGS